MSCTGFCGLCSKNNMAKRVRRANNLDDAFMSVYCNISKNHQILELADLGMKDSTGWSLMHRAIINDDCETLNFLSKAGMSTGVIANDLTPLQLATERGNLEAMRVLLESGCSEEILNNGCLSSFSPLQMAFKSRSETSDKMIKMLLSYGCDVNKPDFYQESSQTHTLPLGCAIRRRNYDLVELLLQHGAKITIGLNSELVSFFIDAILVSCKDIVDLLILYGADVNVAQKSSRVIHRWRLSHMTPLQAALLAHDTAVMKTLLSHKANPNIGLKQRALYGFLPCHAPICMSAKKQGLVDHFNILLTNNCALNWEPETHLSSSSTQHSSPLMFVQNHYAIKMLLLFGCRPQTEEEIESFMETVNSHIECESDFGLWLKQYYFNPPSLMHCCRIKIRKCIGLDLENKLLTLNLPKKLCSDILMKDLIDLE